MRNRSLQILPWISVIILLAAVLLTVVQLIRYSRIRASFTPGTKIAGIPVGGLTRVQAADRLVQAYNLPIEIHYGDAIIQAKPASLGFDMDLEVMLAAADQQRVELPFWQSFWDYLWNRLPAAAEVPLSVTITEERLKAYLQSEIASRYDQPAEAAQPIPGTPNFEPGKPGTSLDIERAVILVEDALRSPTARVVNLTYNRTETVRPSLQNLQVLLQQVIDAQEFDGVTEVYLLDLQSYQELNFAYTQGETIPSDVAFTAASTMKIPILVSVFRRLNEPTPADALTMIEQMIVRSENDPADRLMETYLDTNLGPLQVTDDMQALGLDNTFLAGYFYPGAPLLRRFDTTANLRTDVSTSPDAYNQTTPAEMGALLTDIYQCAQSGGGSLAAVFPGEISQAECRTMIGYLAQNRIGVLIQAGLPEGTQLAHKHGWITESDGVIHTISDAGIVYTPSGNYVLVISIYRTQQLIWDDANALFAGLSQGIYNYFNLSGQ